MTSFAVKFLGCKVSHADAMLARQALLAAGHEEVPESDAELHVVNTCCITSEAEAKSRQSVRRSLKAGAQAVYAAGCAVNLNSDQFQEIGPSVRPFVGTADDVAAAIAGDVGACADLDHDLLIRSRLRQHQATRTRGFPSCSRALPRACSLRSRRWSRSVNWLTSWPSSPAALEAAA